VIPVSLVCPDPVVGHARVEADVAGVHLASQVTRSLGEQLPEVCRKSVSISVINYIVT